MPLSAPSSGCLDESVGNFVFVSHTMSPKGREEGMAANREEGIADEVVDQLLEGRDPATVFETGGLVDELKKRLAERMLNAELDHHPATEAEEEAGNQRMAKAARSF